MEGLWQQKLNFFQGQGVIRPFLIGALVAFTSYLVVVMKEDDEDPSIFFKNISATSIWVLTRRTFLWCVSTNHVVGCRGVRLALFTAILLLAFPVPVLTGTVVGLPTYGEIWLFLEFHFSIPATKTVMALYKIAFNFQVVVAVLIPAVVRGMVYVELRDHSNCWRYMVSFFFLFKSYLEGQEM
jgi:hypothetical protein